jgi:hypothetical protein
MGRVLIAEHFWDRVQAKGLLTLDSLILAGDLNFTTSIEEVWGADAIIDPLGGYFTDLFAKNQLVDVQSAELVPTWRNGRLGSQSIQK